MKNLSILLLSLSLLSCGLFKKKASTDELTAESVIKMKTGPCFGTCPVYTFTLNGLGEATYEGQRFVKKEGTWKKEFTTEETKALFVEFQKLDFFGYDDEYTANVTDLPTTWLTYTHDGRTKTIRCYYDVPKELQELIAKVDEASNTERWTLVGAPER